MSSDVTSSSVPATSASSVPVPASPLTVPAAPEPKPTAAASSTSRVGAVPATSPSVGRPLTGLKMSPSAGRRPRPVDKEKPSVSSTSEETKASPRPKRRKQDLTERRSVDHHVPAPPVRLRAGELECRAPLCANAPQFSFIFVSLIFNAHYGLWVHNMTSQVCFAFLM